MQTVVYLGADHGGFAKKEVLKQKLQTSGYIVEDCGAFEFQADDDYPQFAFAVAEQVVQARRSGEVAFGVLVCRSGVGMTLAANKVAGARAAAVHSVAEAKHARTHDDVTILSLPADGSQEEDLWKVVEAFIQTPFSPEERHRRRVEQITAYEQS